MGMRCCTDVGEPKEPLLAVDSAVLGSNEANTLEMASAYGTLATGGRHVEPVPVESVVGPDGSILWQADPEPTQVVDPQVAAAANDILQDVVLYGTGTAANLGRPQIGKTGTDDNHDNAWFVGAVPQLSAAVWVGFHEGQIPMEPPRTQDHRVRRHLAGADLAIADAARDEVAAARTVPDAGGAVRVRGDRHDPRAVVPAEPVHAAESHRDRELRVGHRADPCRAPRRIRCNTSSCRP